MDEFEYDNLYDNDNFDDEDQYPKPNTHKPLQSNLYKKADDTDKQKGESEDLIGDFYADKEINDALSKEDEQPVSTNKVKGNSQVFKKKPTMEDSNKKTPVVSQIQNNSISQKVHNDDNDGDIEEFIDSTVEYAQSKKTNPISMSPNPHKDDEIEENYDDLMNTANKDVDIAENIVDDDDDDVVNDGTERNYDYDTKDKKTYESKTDRQPQSTRRTNANEEIYNKKIDVDLGKNYGAQQQQEQHEQENKNEVNKSICGNMDKLREQNLRLKNELRQLAKAADEALRRERQKRMQKKPREIEDAELKEKMLELREQLTKIDHLKHQIQIMKRQLENTYNLPKVIEKEDELRAAQRELNKVMNEKNSLLKIKKEQNKALDFLNNEGEYDKKLKQVSAELRKAKEEHRRQNDLFLENDKVMKRLHERIIVMEEKCKELQKLIKQKKNDKTPPEPEVNDNEIKELEAQLRELQERKKILDSNFDQDIKELKTKKASLQGENAKLSNYIKEKEKEIRLNNLRLKELRKLSKLNTGKVLNTNNSISNYREDSISDGKRSPRRSSQEKSYRINSRPSSKGPQRTNSNRDSKRSLEKESQPNYPKDQDPPMIEEPVRDSVDNKQGDQTADLKIEAHQEYSNVRGDDETYDEEKFEEDIIDDYSVEKEAKAFKIQDEPGIGDKMDSNQHDDHGQQKKGVFSKPFGKKK